MGRVLVYTPRSFTVLSPMRATLDLTAQRLDVPAQGRQEAVVLALEARQLPLIHAHRLGCLFLRDAGQPAELAQAHLPLVRPR